ncbi:MAG: hypothetical protein QUV05_13335 [Phycisphaerae bacterium]|nr:hypothetical protein [Phycisphaerae bacterium]
MNLSTRFYAAFEIRAHDGDGASQPFVSTELLAPGAVFRVDCAELIGQQCPASLDVRVLLYRRVLDDQDPPVPIGMDEAEAVEPQPVAADEFLDVPGPCAVFPPVGTYTIVNWDTDAGRARVKFAQESQVDALISRQNVFGNEEAVWDFTGVREDLASTAPPPLMESAALAGRVTLVDGTGVAGVGVLLRTRYRVRIDDNDPGNDPDAGYGDPIDYRFTDESGYFQFERPPGVYQSEFFSDEYAFAPATVEVETPLSTVGVLADPL